MTQRVSRITDLCLFVSRVDAMLLHMVIVYLCCLLPLTIAIHCCRPNRGTLRDERQRDTERDTQRDTQRVHKGTQVFDVVVHGYCLFPLPTVTDHCYCSLLLRMAIAYLCCLLSLQGNDRRFLLETGSSPLLWK